jgi:hypothetical protein
MEKVYLNYRLEVLNKGGHSSVPSTDNAIYHLAEGLARLTKFSFPVNLNATTRANLARTADFEGPQTAADIRSVLSASPDPAALTRLSGNPAYNAQLRTTCVATMLEGGHAENALPQTARALVNCRIMPGEKFDDIKATLTRVLADDQIAVKQVGDAKPSDPAVIDEELLATIEKTSAEFWPGVPVVPIMSAGATDGLFFAQRRHPNLRPLGPRERRRRRARPRQGRARGGQVVLRRRRISSPPCQAAVGWNLAIGTRRWAALWATGPLSCGAARGRARSVVAESRKRSAAYKELPAERRPGVCSAVAADGLFSHIRPSPVRDDFLKIHQS